MSNRTKNETITLYPHPFSRAYWREAAKECTRLRSLTVAALLCALAIVIEKFQIPLGTQSQQLAFSFLVILPCSMLTGPLMAIPCGVIVDVIGWIGSGYEFFPGYTLTAVLTALVYALFLYRARPTFTRILLAKGFVNVFINTLLGSVWRVTMYGGTYAAHAVITIIINALKLPIEVFLLCLFFRAMQKPLQQLGFLPPDAEVTYRNRNFVTLAVISVVCVALIIPYAIWYKDINAFVKGLF